MTQDIDILLLRYHRGEATQAEIAQCKAWLEESDDNKKYYEQMLFIMQHTGSSTTSIEVDVDAAWQKMQQKLGFEQGVQEKPKLRKLHPNRRTMLSIAASVALLLGIGAWWWNNSAGQNEAAELQFASTNTTTSKKMDDGSTVSLAKHSRLRYAQGFGTDNRRVELEGEAFFEVKHDEELPFTVVTQGVTITDVGTAFNVESRLTDSVIVIAVTEGIVDIKTADQQSQRLTKGQTARYNKNQNSLQIDSAISVNAASHKTRRFVFTNVLMDEVITQLNSAYEQEISLASSDLHGRRISVEFNNESLEFIVSILCETLQCKSTKTEKGFVLENK